MKQKMSSPLEPQILRSHGESHRERQFAGGKKISQLVDGRTQPGETPRAGDVLKELPETN